MVLYFYMWIGDGICSRKYFLPPTSKQPCVRQQRRGGATETETETEEAILEKIANRSANAIVSVVLPKFGAESI